MKNAVLLILLLFSFDCVQAQDGDLIYSEISDTLVKQNFIDRYESVFMTQVPTRHMFKLEFTRNRHVRPSSFYNDFALSNSFLGLGYEYKFAPALSIAVSGYVPFRSNGISIKSTWQSVAFDAQIKWFFDMQKKARSQRTANNFNGKYLAINYNYRGSASNYAYVGLKAGFQHRFLNNGFMDFALAAQGLLSDWSVSTQTSFGFALGDWKRSTVPPLCDIILCDEHVREHWKITLPELTFGNGVNRIRLGVGFERKLGQSPVSLNLQYDIGLHNGFVRVDSKELRGLLFSNSFDRPVSSRELLQIITFQPRYYLFHNRQRLNGKGGYGLSGIYTGVHSEISFYWGAHDILTGKPLHNQNLNRNMIRAGLLAGFQQRVFSRGFLDLNTSYNIEKNLTASQITTGLKAYLGIGFAF